MSKVLFAVTNHDQLGSTGKKTGFYMSELTYAWSMVVKSGFTGDFVSPKGGTPPVDGYDLSDPINKEFVDHPEGWEKAKRSLKPGDINPDDYVAIYFTGGHGPMWDFTDNEELKKIALAIYHNGGIISALCHGVSGLVNMKLADGSYFVKGKHLNSYTNEEEIAANLTKVVPYMLEQKLIEQGAIFHKAGWHLPHVEVDERLITGQNPQSGKLVGQALVSYLNALGK